MEASTELEKTESASLRPFPVERSIRLEFVWGCLLLFGVRDRIDDEDGSYDSE